MNGIASHSKKNTTFLIHLFKAVVTSRILNGDDRRLVGIAAAKMAQPVRFDQLPSGEQARTSAVAICTYQLKDPPEWVLRWIQEDLALLDGISRVLEEHEYNYFRGDAAKSGEDSEVGRVAISPLRSSTASTK